MRSRLSRAALSQQQTNFQTGNRVRFMVGIDPGTHTGFAVWDRQTQSFSNVETLSIYRAIKSLEILAKNEGGVHVRIEDATARNWFGNSGREKLKGAGSVERDCAIWVEVCNELKVPFDLVHPKDVQAPAAAFFKRLTCYPGRTSVHARDAAWMVFKK